MWADAVEMRRWRSRCAPRKRKSQMQKADFAARHWVYLTVKASQIQMESDWTYVRKEKEEKKNTCWAKNPPTPTPPKRLLCISRREDGAIWLSLDSLSDWHGCWARSNLKKKREKERKNDI